MKLLKGRVFTGCKDLVIKVYSVILISRYLPSSPLSANYSFIFSTGKEQDAIHKPYFHKSSYVYNWLVNRGSTSQGGCWPGWVQPRTSLWWTEGYYPEINPIGNKFWTRILYVPWFGKVFKVIQCCLASKGYKEFGPADLPILNVANILRGGEIMRNPLY